MRIIPALDIKNGQAVKAQGGDRSRYHPLETHADPVQAAIALMAKAKSDVIYVADLDAITGLAPQDETIAKIAQIPGLKELWLDSGIRTEADLPLKMGPNLRLVLGTETLTDSTLLLQAAAEFGGKNVILSWDFKDGQWLGSIPPDRYYEDVFFAGIRQNIILDLHRVGSGNGPGHLVNTTKQLKQRFPAAEIYPGGGIRNKVDMQELEHAGANGVLVATALWNDDGIEDV